MVVRPQLMPNPNERFRVELFREKEGVVHTFPFTSMEECQRLVALLRAQNPNASYRIEIWNNRGKRFYERKAG